MHSRIFQVSTEPIDKSDYITESSFWGHWFIGSIADYISENCYRDEDLKWFEDCSEQKGIEFGVDENGEYFIVLNKQKYFENSFHKFMTTIDKIKNYTIDDFVNGFNEMWHLKNAYEDKYGFYIDADGELMTFDNFIRDCAMEEKFYIGGTIDYHC